jgi:hypothetical protein
MNFLKLSLLVALLGTPLAAGATCRSNWGNDPFLTGLPFTGVSSTANTIYWSFMSYDDDYPVDLGTGFMLGFHAQLSGTAGGKVQLALYQNTGSPRIV